MILEIKMEREYNNANKTNDAIFFTGVEVEKTPTCGMKTLFVVGIQPAKAVIQTALQLNCKAIYFGANHSFDMPDKDQWDGWHPWEKMIKGVLADSALFWCSLDFDLEHMQSFLESGLAENIRMIPVVSVKMPYIEQLGYNAVIKIDDKGFNQTNPGVWCHSIQTATHPSAFTHWQDYNDDELIQSH